MKLNSNQIRVAALAALLAGFGPALQADADRSMDQTTTTVPGETDRDARAEDRLNQQRPGHNSDSVAAGTSNTSTTVVYGDTSRNMSDQLHRGSANELTGMNVRNRSGESLGRIKDFVIDTNSGQVVYAVVGSGGVAGIGETLHAVPVQALNHDTSGNKESLTLDIESSRWAQAPRFKKDRLSSLQMDQEGRATFDYYGQTWRSSGQTASINNPVRNQGNQAGTTVQQQTSTRQGQLLALASDLIGKNIRTSSQNIGTIEDVILQLQSGSAAVLFDPDNDFAGSDQKYVVPLNKFAVMEGSALGSTLTRADFSSAQMSERNAWASAQPGQSNSLYIWQDGRRNDSARYSGQQGTPPVADIRRAIQGDSSLAAGQSNIRVDADGNKVILRGTVQTEDAKDKIEDRAERAAPGWNIDNQISVAGTDE